MARAKTRDEDIVFQECHWRYPWRKKLQEPMKDTHLVLHVRVGPEHRGWPVRRSRGLCAALNRETLLWVGPEDYETDFHEKFSRRLQITGEEFFFAKDSEWLADSMNRAHCRGLYPNEEELKAMNPAKYRNTVLPPSGVDHWRQHEEKRKSKQANDPTPGQAWFSDLQQGILGPATPGPLIPSCLTHFSTWSHLRNRRMLGVEALVAHGWHLRSEFSDDHTSRLAPFIEVQSEEDLQFLCGNGYHLSVLLEWYLYVLSHTVRRVPMTISRPPSLKRKGDSGLLEEEEPEVERSSKSSAG